MSLPKISLPLFELKIPSSGEKIKYRPFTVKEEKILLIAQESKEIDQIILSIKQIINNCVENIDVEKLAMFDLEYILINIRAKSVNNMLTFAILDPDTEERVELELDIESIELKKDPKHTNKIKFENDGLIVMRYPAINEVKLFTENRGNSSKIFEIMVSCIEKIVLGEEVYNTSDFSPKELEEWIDDLDSKVIKELEEFFDTIPTLRYEKTYTNKDGDEKTFVVEGMETFFI